MEQDRPVVTFTNGNRLADRPFSSWTMRGLPSREWRTGANNYGATQQVSATWKDQLLLWTFWIAEHVGKLVRVIMRNWKQAWTWSISLSTRPRRIMATSILIMGTVLVCGMVTMRGYSWLFKEDPCIVAERERISVMEEEETDGVFTQLPKIIHWESPRGDSIPSGQLSEWNTQFRRLFPEPEFKHMLWTRKKIRELIDSKYSWYLVEFDRNADDPLAQIRNTKYFILNEYGGLYASLDYQVVRNFWDSLPKNRPALSESPFKYSEEYQDVLISSPPGHPFWNVTIDLMATKLAQASNAGWIESRPKISSNAILNEAVRKAKRTALGDAAVHQLPCENFNRVPVGQYAEYLPFYSRWARSILAMTFLVKQCGSIDDSKCQFGMYHDSAMPVLAAA